MKKIIAKIFNLYTEEEVQYAISKENKEAMGLVRTLLKILVNQTQGELTGDEILSDSYIIRNGENEFTITYEMLYCFKFDMIKHHLKNLFYGIYL